MLDGLKFVYYTSPIYSVILLLSFIVIVISGVVNIRRGGMYRIIGITVLMAAVLSFVLGGVMMDSQNEFRKERDAQENFASSACIKAGGTWVGRINLGPFGKLFCLKVNGSD